MLLPVSQSLISMKLNTCFVFNPKNLIDEEQFWQETCYNNFYYYNLLNSTNVYILPHIGGNAISETPDNTVFWGD